MPSKRLIQAGHFLAIVFVVLLLVGARGYLAAHPFVAGLLLAAFAPAYLAAARISGYRQFLCPAALLLVVGWQLVLHGAGLPLHLQPLFAVIPVAFFAAAAEQGWVRKPGGAGGVLHAANEVVIFVFTAWVLLRAAWFYEQSPLSAAAALGLYAVYAGRRFLRTRRAWHALLLAALGTPAFLFGLYAYTAATIFAAVAAGTYIVARLFYGGMMGSLDAAAFGGAGIFLLYMVAFGPATSLLPLGWIVLAGIWLHLALALHRPEQPPLLGARPSPLPGLLPLFTAGVAAGLVPIALFYPWKPIALVAAYLGLVFLIFLAAARQLGGYALGLIGVLLARLLASVGRAAPVAVLMYVAANGFPAGFRLALAAFSIAVLSLLWGAQQQPRLLSRRNVYVYQAGAFLTLAYFAARTRTGIVKPTIDSGLPVMAVLIALAWILRDRVAPAYQQSVYEAAALPAIVAALAYPLRGPINPTSAALLGLPLVFSSLAAFRLVLHPATLFTVPVVLGFWLYVAQWVGGVRGEWLGLPYLVFGFGFAACGWWLLNRGSLWSPLLYFMWFLSVAVSLALFAPYAGVGAWLAPLWPVTLVLVSRSAAARRDLAPALLLEISGGALAAAGIAVLVTKASYGPAALALTVYAALYAWIAARNKVWSYLYASAGCFAAACHVAFVAAGTARLSFVWFLPAALALYGIAALLRQNQQPRQAFPLELAASGGAVAGALVLLAQPFAANASVGAFAALVYCVLFVSLVRATGERAFLAGAGLALAVGIFELLPRIPAVTPANRLAFIAPVALALMAAGRALQRRNVPRGGWPLYSAAIVVTAAASVFALWPAAPAASRTVLVIALAAWVLLLLWTAQEIFIYCATLTLALLSYHFVQSSNDRFGQHLVGFFLYGAAVLGLVFVAAVARNLLRFRRPLLLAPPAGWRHRFLYIAPVALLGLATFGSWGVSTSSNPLFCGTCHDMGTYFANWKASPHGAAQIGCATCHYEPGLRGYARAKLQGVSELVLTLTGTQAHKPAAAVSDHTCLSSGCHSTAELARVRRVSGKYFFSHATHTGPLSRGPELRCGSCHTDVGPETHFALDTNACFTCHLKAASPPKAVSATGCVTCHGALEGPRGASAYSHAGTEAKDQACAACHEGVSRGTQAVEQRRCRHCHIERPAALMKAGQAEIHRRHVREASTACDRCHGVIRHERGEKTD